MQTVSRALQGRRASCPATMINDLNDVAPPLHGLYSEDIDHSGVFTSADLLRLIDLLNGAGAYDPWNGTPLPDSAGCP